MTRYVAEALMDERYGISGGKLGDQTGNEVKVNRFWRMQGARYYRYCGPDRFAVRNRIAVAAVKLAENDNVGYDQGNRASSYQLAKAAGWKAAKMGELGKCETDCSELVAIAVNCGLQKAVMQASNWTGNEAALLKAAGFKEVKSIGSDGSGLCLGDICLAHNAGGLQHTSVYIGTKRPSKYVKQYATCHVRYVYSKKGVRGKKGKPHRLVRVPAGAKVTYLHSSTSDQIRASYKGKTGWLWKRKGAKPAIKVASYEGL